MAQHHGGDLGVEQRLRNGLGAVPDDFDVLPCGVEDLQHPLVAHQVEKRSKVDALRKRVDHHGFLRARQLRDAEQRVVGGFAQELGVDRDERVLGKALTGGGQFARRFDGFHAGLLAHDPEKWKPASRLRELFALAVIVAGCFGGRRQLGKDHVQTKETSDESD